MKNKSKTYDVDLTGEIIVRVRLEAPNEQAAIACAKALVTHEMIRLNSGLDADFSIDFIGADGEAWETIQY